MPAIEWDKTNERRFETGIDRGVLYLPDRRGIPWNGLTGVEENSAEASNPFFLDGIKYLDVPTIEDYEAKLTALTFPDEFEQFDGVIFLENGGQVDNQGAKQFGLSYRTVVGNDTQGVDFGHKIHLVYNLTAQIEPLNYVSDSNVVAPVEFAWTIFAVPENLPGYRPTAHVIFDTTRLNPFFVEELEGILYGSNVSESRLPTLDELKEFAMEWTLFDVIDNGDGSWTITGPDELISIDDNGRFRIDQIDATYLDHDKYVIPTTEP